MEETRGPQGYDRWAHITVGHDLYPEYVCYGSPGDVIRDISERFGRNSYLKSVRYNREMSTYESMLSISAITPLNHSAYLSFLIKDEEGLLT